MKKTLLVLIAILFAAGVSAQTFKQPVNAQGGLKLGINGTYSGIGNRTFTINPNSKIFLIDSITQVANQLHVWKGLTDLALGGAGSMTYPDAGIALSTGAAWGTSITNNSVNWDSAYAARLRWSGTATGLTAATGRTSLGGTTAGQALFTLTNPSAITFLRVNADNSATALSAFNFRTAIGGTGVGTAFFTLVNPSAITFPLINADNSVTAQSAADFKTSLSLNNVANESRATILGNAALTGTATIQSGFTPLSSDGAALGSSSLQFSDLFLASGGVVNYSNGNVVMTHSTGVLTIGTGTLKITTPTNNTTSVVTIDGTQTLTNKTITSPFINEAVALTTTATKLNYLTGATGTTGTATTNIVYSTSPVLTTPSLGIATATSIDASGILETGANSGTGGQLTLLGATSGSAVLKVNAIAGSAIVFQLPSANGSNGNILTTDGAGVTSWAEGGAGVGDMILNTAQTVTGAKTFGTIGGTVGKLILAGSTSGSTILNAAATAGSGTVTLPVTGTLAISSGAQTFTGLQTVTVLKVGTVVGGSKIIQQDSVITDNTTTPTLFKMYSGATQLIPDIPTAGQVNLNTIITLQSDTIPLFTIGGGNNLSGSQPAFLPNADLGVFSNVSLKDTLYITSGRFFCAQDSGTVTMGFRFYKHATTYPTSASTDMMSNVITLSAATSATTTGTVITHASTPHFDVFALYPGESVAAIVTVKSNGNMPKLMRGTVYGYKQNRSY